MTQSKTGKRRREIARRDGWLCHYCGVNLKRPSEHAATVDHKMPRVLGGSDQDSNLVLSCQSCNLLKADTPYNEFIVEHNYVVEP